MELNDKNEMETFHHSKMANSHQENRVTSAESNQQQKSPFHRDVINLREVFNAILRRKWSVLFILVLVFFITVYYTLSITPTYRAITTIKIDKEESEVVPYKVYEKADDINYYQTQYNLLKSRKLASRVIKQLNLKEYYKTHQVKETTFDYYVGQFKAVFIPSTTENTAKNNTTNDEANQLGKKPIELQFLESLDIVPIHDSNIVQIYYVTDNAKMSAKIVNAVAKNYIELNIESKSDSSIYAKKFIAEQLSMAKIKLQSAEKELVSYAKKNKIINTDNNSSIISSELQALSTAYVQAKNMLNFTESTYREKHKVSGDIRSMDNATIQALKQKQTALEETYASLSGLYKSEYPEMLKMHEQIKTIKDQITQETDKISHNSSESLKSDFLTAKKNVSLLEERLNNKKREILNLRDKNIGYQVIEREVTTNREIYNGLLQRLKEIEIASGAVSNNISIIDPAFIPYKEFEPNIRKNLFIGLLLGLLLSGLFVFYRESKDDNIRTQKEVEVLTGLPIIGYFPFAKGKEKPLLFEVKKISAISEAFRSILTDLTLSIKTGIPKILHITGSTPNEGKSSTSVNLALVMAQEGKKVVIIDGDLRRPTIDTLFGVEHKVGLTDYLTERVDFEHVLIKSIIKNISLIPAGSLADNPVKLLASDRMIDLLEQLSEEYDQVIIDSPPVLGMADALILANRSYATLFIVSQHQAKKESIRYALNRLERSYANVIGIILTKVVPEKGSPYDSNLYHKYGREGIEILPIT